MDTVGLVLTGLGVALGAMTLLWVVSVIVRDSSIVDMVWGPGLALLGVTYYLLGDGGFEGRKVLLVLLVVVWGLRLGIYLTWRNLGKGEDFRYREWREQHGKRWWWWSLFQVYWLQAVVMWVVSLTMIPAQVGSLPARLIWLDYVGVAFWAIGMFFETVGDWQLMRFKANPENKGKVLNTGLWRYTRHPNYFGDFMVWWGHFFVSAAVGGWWAVIGPAVMSWMLMQVSGVALLEKSLKVKKPQYAEYERQTSAFFPWFPKK